MAKASFSDHFGKLRPFSATCSLEVTARVSLKVVTIRHLIAKKSSKVNIFEAISLKQKQRSANKVIHIL